MDVITVTPTISGQEERSVFVVHRQVRWSNQCIHQRSTVISIGAAVIGKNTSTIRKATDCSFYIGIDIVHLCIVLVHLIIVVSMGCTNTIIGILATATNRNIILLVIGITEIFIPPICICHWLTWSRHTTRNSCIPRSISNFGCIRRVIIQFVNKHTVIVGVHHVHFLGWSSETGISVKADFRFTFRTFFGGNHNNTIRTTNTINST